MYTENQFSLKWTNNLYAENAIYVNVLSANKIWILNIKRAKKIIFTWGTLKQLERQQQEI